MSALVVVETYFGNTRHIADVVANGLRSDGIDTEVVTVQDAPTQLEDGIELLVIGAPTHDLGLREPPGCLRSPRSHRTHDRRQRMDGAGDGTE